MIEERSHALTKWYAKDLREAQSDSFTDVSRHLQPAWPALRSRRPFCLDRGWLCRIYVTTETPYSVYNLAALTIAPASGSIDMERTRFVKPGLLIAGGLIAMAALGGCVGKYKSTFPVIIINRTANTLAVLANGNGLGEVTAGQSSSFNISAQETNANVFSNGVAPTPQSEVIFQRGI